MQRVRARCPTCVIVRDAIPLRGELRAHAIIWPQGEKQSGQPEPPEVLFDGSLCAACQHRSIEGEMLHNAGADFRSKKA